MIPFPESVKIQIEELLLRTYMKRFPEGFLETEGGQFILAQHCWERHAQALGLLAPWAERTAGIRGLRVVELGSGTGSSAAGFAGFTGSFDGYEVEDESVSVAEQRLAILGIDNARVHLVAGEEILDTIAERHEGRVDVFLLYAVLEHMTIEERLSALRLLWGMLPPGGLMIIIETPNRLTYTDLHTSQLPFYHMLPLELAAQYYEHSPRAEFVQTMRDSPDREMGLTRWGTAVSFHEFDLALDRRPDDLIVADGFEKEITQIYPIRFEDRLLQKYFEKARVERHRAFTRNHLNFILRKPD